MSQLNLNKFPICVLVINIRVYTYIQRGNNKHPKSKSMHVMMYNLNLKRVSQNCGKWVFLTEACPKGNKAYMKLKYLEVCTKRINYLGLAVTEKDLLLI